MRILHLTYRVPYPANDGGAIAIYNMILGLVQNGCEIDLVAINTPKHKQPVNAMKSLVNQYDVFVDTTISFPKLVKNIFFSTIPYNVERFFSRDVEEQLENLLKQKQYDFIQIESAFTALYIDVIRKHTDSPVIIRTHNIEYIIWRRLAINERNPLKKWFYNHLSKRLKKFEAIYYNKADGIASITKEDKARMIEMGVNVPVKVVPAGVVLDNYLSSDNTRAKNNTVFCISSLDWMPNLEGLDWFLKNVWGEVLKAKPEVELHIAGKSTPKRIRDMDIPNVIIHGFVKDALLFKKSYRIMLVPLLSGSGMRVKIAEGLAAGKCIISTTIGAEGIGYTNRENIVISDKPKEWVDAIVYYLENESERKKIEKNAEELAKNEFENIIVTKKIIDLYQQIRKQTDY